MALVPRNVTTPLLNLAKELLFMIFEELEDEDLYSLSFSSKYLHRMALQTLMFRHGGMSIESQVILSGPPPFLLLRPLRLSLFVQHVEDVVVLARNAVAKSLTELQRLFQRMSHVRGISIDVFSVRPKQNDRRVLQAVENLLFSLAGKGCIKLHLYGLYVGEEQSATADERGTRDDSVPPFTTLQTVHLQDSEIFAETIRIWIINSVNISPITTLTLERTDFSMDTPITSILSQLTLPHLQHFTISSARIDYLPLVTFISRHPGIVDLSIETNNPITSTTPIPQHALPAMHTLKAPPLYICRFLALPDSLCSLRDLTIAIGVWDRSMKNVREHLDGIEDCFMFLGSREHISSLSVQLPGDAEVDYWLQHGSRQHDGPRRDLERNLKFVTTVTVNLWVGYMNFPPATRPLFAQWLALFPALQHVSFPVFAFFPPSIQDSTISNAIAKACPHIRSVRIGWEVYKFNSSSCHANHHCHVY